MMGRKTSHSAGTGRGCNLQQKGEFEYFDYTLSRDATDGPAVCHTVTAAFASPHPRATHAVLTGGDDLQNALGAACGLLVAQAPAGVDTGAGTVRHTSV